MSVSSNEFPTSAQPTPDLGDAGPNCPCGHLLAGHDRIAARYCSATAASGLDRACVCRDLQPETASILYAAP